MLSGSSVTVSGCRRSRRSVVARRARWAAEAGVLVVVRDRDGEVGAVLVGVRRDPRLADARLAVEGEPHLDAVEVGEQVLELTGQPGRRVEEALVAGLRREAGVELDDRVAVGRDGPAGRQPATVAKKDVTGGGHVIDRK